VRIVSQTQREPAPANQNASRFVNMSKFGPKILFTKIFVLYLRSLFIYFVCSVEFGMEFRMAPMSVYLKKMLQLKNMIKL
jgi:hypothetical protein